MSGEKDVHAWATKTSDQRSKRDADRPLTPRWRNKTGINQTTLDRRLFNSPYASPFFPELLCNAEQMLDATDEQLIIDRRRCCVDRLIDGVAGNDLELVAVLDNDRCSAAARHEDVPTRGDR